LFLFGFSNNGCDVVVVVAIGVDLNDVGFKDVVIGVGVKDVFGVGFSDVGANAIVVVGFDDVVVFGVVLSVGSLILWIASNDSIFSVDFNDVVVGGGVGFNDVFGVV
jgi:hypothetical protein